MSSPDEKKKLRRIVRFRLDEVSLVDKPAHTPARIAIMKRAVDTPTVEPIQKKMAMTSLTAGHAHTVIMVQAHSEGLAELRAGQTSFADNHTHDWVMDDAGNIIFADAEGHTHGLSILITKVDDGIDNDILAESLLASLAPAPEQASDSAATGGTEIQKMTPEEKAAFEQAAQDKQTELTKRAVRAESIVKLSPEQRAHYDALPTNEQEDFLGNEDKDTILKNLTDADPVIYKSRDGDEFRKSDDQRLVKAAQRADKAEERVEKGEKLAKRAGFEKLAKEELGHLKGDDSAKADLLEGVDALPIEKREAVMAILKSKDAGMAKAFEQVGETGSDEGVDAEAKLTALAKAHRESHKDLSPEQAYVAVLETPEGQELHAQLTG
jgi:hypothetical protein